MKKSNYLFILKLLIGIGLITFLLSSIEMGSLLERLSNIDARYLLLVFLSPHIAMFLSTIKWKILLALLHIHATSLRLFCLYMIGTFFSNFLPTMIGGDAIKAYTLYQETGQPEKVIASTFMDRLMGLTALVSLLPLILLQQDIRDSVPLLPLLLAGITLGYIILLILIFSPVFTLLGNFTFRHKLLAKGYEFLKSTHETVRLFRHHKKALLVTYVISLGFYAFTILTPWLVSRSLGLEISYLYLAAFVPIVMLSTIVPVSLNGLGITEAGYAIFLQMAGVPIADAIAIALVLRIRFVITGLIGGLIFIKYKAAPNNKAATANEECITNKPA
ncbi:hypothetical protein IMCC1989_2709 [gamma proteobacterium IMCC1989]|nr:hypothetical protein IMCC1989_2709 [gamma proteobacterium IMCC1989]